MKKETQRRKKNQRTGSEGSFPLNDINQTTVSRTKRQKRINSTKAKKYVAQQKREREKKQAAHKKRLNQITILLTKKSDTLTERERKNERVLWKI